jgi:hypothetical protein
MKLTCFCLPLIAAGLSASAHAQSSVIPSVIGQTILDSMRGSTNRPEPTAECYDGRWMPKPLHLQYGPERVDLSMQTYLQIAAAGANIKKVFTGGKRVWQWKLDGVEQDVQAARDPWAAQNARVERIAFVASNYGGQYRALWRAVAVDGSVLGTYEGLLIWDGVKARFLKLDLYSAGATRQPDPAVPFCRVPGDIAKWQEAKANSEAETPATAQ